MNGHTVIEEISGNIYCTKCKQNWNEMKGESPPILCLDDPEDIPTSLRKRSKVPDILDSAQATFEERNKAYGGIYLRLGKATLALFPEGGIPACVTEEEVLRLRFITMCVCKLQRYCANFKDGGHRDSAEDLIVYSAMLKEVTK